MSGLQKILVLMKRIIGFFHENSKDVHRIVTTYMEMEECCNSMDGLLDICSVFSKTFSVDTAVLPTVQAKLDLIKAHGAP